ncbi:hypothetical protein D3C72_1232920 [compost metagenome]
MNDLPTPGAGPLSNTTRLRLPASANCSAVRKLRRLSIAGSSGCWHASRPALSLPAGCSASCWVLYGMVEYTVRPVRCSISSASAIPPLSALRTKVTSSPASTPISAASPAIMGRFGRSGRTGTSAGSTRRALPTLLAFISLSCCTSLSSACSISVLTLTSRIRRSTFCSTSGSFWMRPVTPLSWLLRLAIWPSMISSVGWLLV